MSAEEPLTELLVAASQGRPGALDRAFAGRGEEHGDEEQQPKRTGRYLAKGLRLWVDAGRIVTPAADPDRAPGGWSASAAANEPARRDG